MSAKKFYVVWNPDKSEGFITYDKNDAIFAAEGISPRNGSTAIGEFFRECYVDDDVEVFQIQEIEIEV